MARRVPSENWNVIARHRHWGCFASACFLALVAAIGLALLVWLVRPRAAVHPLDLIGSDVDGLVLVELSRTSSRVNGFLRCLIRPMSYEVQSRPEDLEQEISQLLDVMTFRRAIGLLRSGGPGGQEQWACVVPLKRMGDGLKVLVRQLVEREAKGGVEMETSGGVLLFWGKPGTPCFAIERRAVVVASDRGWLNEVLSRIEKPLAKTPRANHLYRNLPAGGRNCLARACILLPKGRWDSWVAAGKGTPLPLDVMARIRRVLEGCGLGASDIETLAATAIVQPRQQVHFDLTVACSRTTASLALAHHVSRRWNKLSPILQGPDMAILEEPTTATTGVTFGWTTPQLEQMLGGSPVEKSVPAR
jgi:hypothetical protein